MKKKQHIKPITYGIIGLGRFGFALAAELAANGCELVVVDKDEDTVNKAAEFTENAHIINNISKESLMQAGIHECDTVIIGIAEHIDVCILTTLYVKRMGVKRVVVKANSQEQGDILEMLGAEVVYPERDMAIRVANMLAAPNILEYIELSEDVNIIEIEVTSKIAGKSILNLDLRKRYGLNIIAVRKGSEVQIEFSPSLVLSEGDTITVIGRHENIQRFEADL